MQENINIPDSEITTNLTFRQLVLMNMQQLTNFPYIEKDFDALTDYELLCLVVKFLNDVIANQNEQNASITRMYESFLALQDYVNNTKDELETAFNNLDNYVRNYFANLDVQEEINNKLDDMVEQGTLQEIIYQFLQSNVFWVFNTVADMKSSTNLIDGSYAETLGYYTINDRGDSKYLIQENQPITGYYETLNNGLYALLIIDEELRPEQLGAKGDGVTDDTVPFTTAVNIVKNTNSYIKLLKSYYIGSPVTLNENDRLSIIGNFHTEWKNNIHNIIIGNNDLFVGAKLSNNIPTETKIGLNLSNISFTSTQGSMGTLFKGLVMEGSKWDSCRFYSLFAVIEGGFNFVSTIRNCISMNIRNFFISDYVFTTPTHLKDIRNGTTTLDSVTAFTIATADSPALFDHCYFNGYNPTTSYTSLDMSCFHLLYYSDSEICGNDCFLDFWYAIEESFRTSGTTNNFSWKNCVFQRSIYFFAFHTANYPRIDGFEFIGNEIVTFGSDQNIVTDKADYTNAKLNMNRMFIKYANILNNYYGSDKYKIDVLKNESCIITSNNRFNKVLDCPILPDTTTQTYSNESIRESRYEELNNKVFEVDTLPDVVTRNSGQVNDLGLYFNGRKFIFKVDTNYYYKTLVRLDDTYLKFI